MPTMRPAFRALACGFALALAASLMPGSTASAAATRYEALADLLKGFVSTDGALDWSDLDRHREVRWVSDRTLLNTNAPDGSSFARPGVATVDGQVFDVAATGSRAGIGSLYISQAAPAAAAEAAVHRLERAGVALTPIRCARDPARPDRFRGWYHIVAGGVQANLYVGPLGTGRQGYTLYLGPIPTMTQEEAANFVDCPGGKRSAAVANAPQTGQAGITAVIEALLRPLGTPARVAWREPLPAIEWNTKGPWKIPHPDWSLAGADPNPEWLNGSFRTPTTDMTVSASGDADGARRFYLEGGRHLPRDAVFDALRRDGYTIKAVTCGKPYLEMSENWFRVAGPGKQAAILYRSMSVSIGEPTETYAIRLDNVAPPLLPGQRSANGGSCPG